MQQSKLNHINHKKQQLKKLDHLSQKTLILFFDAGHIYGSDNSNQKALDLLYYLLIRGDLDKK
ncbi:hypothetical protein BCU94_10285 [Shewanella sp. 10N.286.52.C2]|nr:hypothetical protein BCU94_10285 [Shewanella sp. 10N.286.52.C2]